MKKLLVVFALFSILLSGCVPASPNPTIATFVPLPPPVNGQFPLSLTYMSVGANQIMDLVSPNFDVRYRETTQGIGGTASELVTLPDGARGVMQSVTWGDLWGGQVTRIEYYNTAKNNWDPQCVIAGVVQVNVPRGSILQWMQGLSKIRYEVDRSRLNLLYVAPKPCEQPVLSDAVYNEAWLGTNENPLLMGSTAAWQRENLAFLPTTYSRWGFWESHDKPFDQVSTALAAARDGLSQKPDYLAVNIHALQELFGRREAFVVRRRGVDVGTITFDYKNGWGRGPNQNWIGNGAVSRVEWRVDGKYFALVELTPALPIGGVPPSTVAIFVDDEATANQIESRADWVTLYNSLRHNDNPHVILAMHLTGDLSKITKDVKVTNSDGETSTGKVDVGIGGGVAYSVFGNPTNEDVVFAHTLLSSLGWNGIRALGLHYPSVPGSGSGLNYYVSVLRIVTDKNPLNHYGADVGTIDRVGYPSYTPLCWKCNK